MVHRRLTLSLAAVFAALCRYYRGGLKLLPTVALPVAAHELSHVLALWLLGRRITSFRLDAQGFKLAYSDDGSAHSDVMIALAGPLGGVLYALLADRAGIDWLEQSAGVSLLLTAFNLLPILPLDGGRVFFTLCERHGADRLYRAVGDILITLLLVGGVVLAARQKSTVPLAAALWLMLLREDEEGLVKSGRIG